ncbi:MAG: class III extradiol ring-cleavage dioxygenase, partial [Azonexus sp.]
MTQNPSAIFVPHGAPTFALRPGAAGAALTAIAKSLPLPRAIAIVSAHWDTVVPTVGFAERPETIHDFWGFPDELYDIRYPATGCREASEEVFAALKGAGMPAIQDVSRGLDHGAWVPLRLMFPDADVPVIPLSIQSRGGPEQAYKLGQALAPLAAKGFLVIASGNLTHNLRDYQLATQRG